MRKKGYIIGGKVHEKGCLDKVRDYISEHKYSIIAHAFATVCFVKGTYDIVIEKDTDVGLEEYKAGLIALGGGEWIKHSHENPRNRKKTMEILKERYPDASLYKTITELYEQASGHLEGTKEGNILKFIMEESNNLEEYKKTAKSIIDGKYSVDIDIDNYIEVFRSVKNKEGREDILENIRNVRDIIKNITDSPHPIFEFKDTSKLK